MKKEMPFDESKNTLPITPVRKYILKHFVFTCNIYIFQLMTGRYKQM